MKQLTKQYGQLKGVIALLILIISTSFCFIPILFFGLLKLMPYKPWQAICTRLVDSVVTRWCDVNNTYINKRQSINWKITGLENIERQKWHLVIANHQSWLDIVILQRLFNRKIPVLKFFIKDQLKWVPLLGFSWWAMGCPFMKRYSKAYLAKHPHKQGKDLKSTIKAINTFKQTPASIMNFVEGTRYTPQKSSQQQSPFKHLLKPKAGGISFVMGAMGEQLTSLIDVTIVYNEPYKSLWDFLCHRIKTIQIHIREIHIPSQFCDPLLLSCQKTQQQLRDWLNEQWMEKDKLISHMTA